MSDIVPVRRREPAPRIETNAFEAPEFGRLDFEGTPEFESPSPSLESPPLESPSPSPSPSLESPPLESPSLEAPSLEAPSLEAMSFESPSLASELSACLLQPEPLAGGAPHTQIEADVLAAAEAPSPQGRRAGSAPSNPQVTERARGGSGATRCPYCHDDLQRWTGDEDEAALAERPMACTHCRTLVHSGCAQLHGACVTLGCRGTSFAFVRIPATPRRRRLGALTAGTARRGTPPPPEPCPRDWWLRDAPLLALGLGGVLAMALL